MGDLGPIGAFISAIFGVVFGGVALVRSNRADRARSRLDDAAGAFEVMKGTVDVLRDEGERLHRKITVVEQELTVCEAARIELAGKFMAAEIRIQKLELIIDRRKLGE